MTEEVRAENTRQGDQLWDLLHQEVYTPQQAAQVLNLSERIILSAAYGGDLKATIIKGDVVEMTRTDLVDWLQRRENR